MPLCSIFRKETICSKASQFPFTDTETLKEAFSNEPALPPSFQSYRVDDVCPRRNTVCSNNR